MPAAITHYLQVERVLTGLAKLHPGFEYNKNAVLWGAQGPDFILSHRALPGQSGRSIKKYGAYLQEEEINNLRDEVFAAIPEENFTRLEKSYLIGFFCHSILDRLALPFINYSSQSLADLNPDCDLQICRNNVKSTLDVIILRYEKQQLPSRIQLKRLLPKDEKVKKFVVELFYNLLTENYDADVTKEDILEAMCVFRKFFGLMTDRTGIKKEFVKKIEKWQGKDAYMSSYIRDLTEDDSYDYSNLSHSIWNWPMDGGEERTDSFFDIYEQSIVDSVAFADKFILRG